MNDNKHYNSTFPSSVVTVISKDLYIYLFIDSFFLTNYQGCSIQCHKEPAVKKNDLEFILFFQILSNDSLPLYFYRVSNIESIHSFID